MHLALPERMWMLALVLALAPALTHAAPDGKELYLWHCASCHGLEGRGDGPEAEFFVARPRDLREGFLARYDAEDLVDRLLDGRSLALELDPKALAVRLREVEDIVAHLHRIPDVSWHLVERGEEIWVDRCETCHGPYGRPPDFLAAAPTPPTDLSAPGFQRARSDDEIIRTVRRGHAAMSPVPGVRNDASARAVLAYIRILSPGFDRYSRFCAACHGDDGHPQTEFAEGGRRPTTVFTRAWLEGRNPDQLRAAVSHMLGEQEPAMPHFRGELGRDEARAIVEYLKQTD